MTRIQKKQFSLNTAIVGVYCHVKWRHILENSLSLSFLIINTRFFGDFDPLHLEVFNFRQEQIWYDPKARTKLQNHIPEDKRCWLRLGKFGAKHILLDFWETRKWIVKFLNDEWLNMQKELVYRKIHRCRIKIR